MINKYFLPLLEVTGNLPVRSVAIRYWGLVVLLKMWLERVSNSSIGYSLFEGVLWVFVELILFLVYFKCPFSVDMEGGR